MALSNWLTDAQLRELLDRYVRDAYHEEEWPRQLKALVQTVQDEVFELNALQAIPDDTFVDRMVAIYREAVPVPMYYKAITDQPERVRESLHYLLESEDDLPVKVDAVLSAGGTHNVKGLGKTFWSVFLMALDPARNPYWTNKTNHALEALGMAKWTSRDSPGQAYLRIAEAENALAALHPQADLSAVDHFMHYVTNLEGREILEEWRTPPSETAQVAEPGGESGEPAEVRYWKIAPGLDAWNWEACRDGNYIAMGWDDLGDLSGLTNDQFSALRDSKMAEHEDWKPAGVNQAWRFSQIREGDRIVANHGTSKVLGIGTVVGPYYFVPRERHGHRLPVRWDDTRRRKVEKGGWRRTLIELDGADFKGILSAEPTGDPGAPEGPFTETTFQLLARLRDEPTHEFYTNHRDPLRTHIMDPLKALMLTVRDLLPSDILDTMETDKRVFANILKQFAAQGCWDFYWGAFYPKGGKRTEDAQLFLWINAERLDFGFYIGQYGSTQRERFLANCRENREVLVTAVAPNLPGLQKLLFGQVSDFLGSQEGRDPELPALRFEDWLQDPAQTGIRAAAVVFRQEVLRQSQDALAREIADVYQALFPLVLLATLDEPMPAIGTYLDLDEGPEIAPEYTLSSCARDTGFDEAELESWVRAIERKGQAIVYGPPGTGKTYVAEHLAKHLIGGGDGFCELVQFHPAYAYEDFIQGIRPRPKGDGQLHYPVVPGRFLDFCESAKKRHGRCVLIVDEVNRANLARVFGELMYLLEYRESTIPLAAGGVLRIPKNVRIIGTMNTADRSIALVDHALRRRFAFLRLKPNFDILRHYHAKTGFDVEPLVRVLRRVNNEIGDPHYAVGITFFLRERLSDELRDIWRMEIEPYLDEYFFDQRHKARAFCWDKVAGELLA